MRRLSKSKLMAFRQCPKRLWLEVHQPELKDDSGAKAVFATGNEVGEVACKVFDDKGDGINLDPNLIGWDQAAEQTPQALAAGDRAVFEAYFTIPGAMALADVMRPDANHPELHWEMIEVKSAASLKDYHRDDVAIQTFIAEKSGILLSKSFLAHIDSSFVYQGDGNYQGLFKLEDLTEEARSRADEVALWLQEAQRIVALEEAPNIAVGPHCYEPFDCGFCTHCYKDVPVEQDPFSMLPRLNWKKREAWQLQGIETLDDTPDEQLSDAQAIVKSAHLTGNTYFDAESAKSQLAEYNSPAYFLDYETVSFAVPIWAYTSPYQNIPFQYSLHRVDQDGEVGHFEFLELDGEDPRRALSEALIRQCGTSGPIFVYNASFERRVTGELANLFPDLREGLNNILGRIVDLLPIARQCYYNPLQHGSWSLKAITPAIDPKLSYKDLEGVQVGSDAGVAYLEACRPETNPVRREELRQQMLKYCELDTYATVRIWEYFRTEGILP